MSDIDLAKVGFVGNFNGVTCANDLIVIDGKDFNIKIKNVEREITHCVISKKWLEKLTKKEFDKFYRIFLNLLNAKNTAQSFETSPKPDTVDVDDGDIWFVINDDGSTPNSQVLPQEVITYTQSAKILDNQEGLRKIKKHCHMCPNEETKCTLQEFKKRKGEDEEKTNKQKTLSNALKEQGFDALDETQKSDVVEFIASEIAPIERIRDTDTSRQMLQALKNKENGLTTWQDWVMQPKNQTSIHTVLQNSNKNLQWSNFSSNMVQILAKKINIGGGFFGNSLTIRDEILKKMYDDFCTSTTGKSLGLPKSDAVFSAKKTVTVVYGGKTVPKQKKVDEKGVHHRFRRWRNKKQTFWEYITDKLKK